MKSDANHRFVKIMNPDAKLMKPDPIDLCGVCRRESFKYFCRCEQQDTVLCSNCVQQHCLEKIGIQHSFLPSIAYGPHIQPGYTERLCTRLKNKDRGKEELLRSLSVIDACKLELQAKVEEVTARLSDYYLQVVSKLDALRAEVTADIEDAMKTIDTCVYTDALSSSKPLAKLLWDYRGETIEMFTYKFDMSSILANFERLLKFERLSLNTNNDQHADIRKVENATFVVEKVDCVSPLLSPLAQTDSLEGIVAGYFCPYCKQNIKHKYHLKEHFNLHLKEYIFRCCICNAFFMKRNLFKSHITTNHPEESFRKLLNKSQDFELKGAIQAIDCICQMCGTQITTKDQLFEHAELHSEKFPCPLCKSSTVELKQMECHIKRHLKDTKANFQCLVCSNKYKNLSTVKKHIDAIHQGISIDAAVREIQGAPSVSNVCLICREPLKNIAAMMKHAEEHSRLGMEIRKKIKSMEVEGEDFSSSDRRSESSGL